MAIRTNPAAIRAAVPTVGTTDLGPFIRTANALTDKVSSNDSESLLNDAMLFEIETYLAAHFYALYDPAYTERKTGEASGKFQGEYGKRLESTDWGQTAMMLDLTGYLDGVNRGKIKASVAWLGLAPSSQTAYQDRD